jgi:uncharacterized membrane protein YgdD (TMEM256/DUF423 family)
MNKQAIVTGSIFGALAVIAGAFGAHGLKQLIDAQQLAIWHTAVEYQFYHVFALLFLSVFPRDKNRLLNTSYYLFTFGIIFFSGSLYLLACSSLINWNWLWIMGPITPIGGLLFIAGWITLLLAALRSK